jgi:hypothetical protein
LLPDLTGFHRYFICSLSGLIFNAKPPRYARR